MADSVAWVIPSVDDLKDVLADRAVEAFRTKALGETQTDPFTRVMQTVTNRIRSEIERRQTLSETEYSVPPSLLRLACLMIVKAMEGRLPGVNLTPQHDEERRDGVRYLERINRGDVQVETPTDPRSVPLIQMASNAEIVTSSTRVATRDLLNGL
jgi:hypothetical protein